jgi:hypothetical protein
MNTGGYFGLRMLVKQKMLLLGSDPTREAPSSNPYPRIPKYGIFDKSLSAGQGNRIMKFSKDTDNAFLHSKGCVFRFFHHVNGISTCFPLLQPL